VVQTSLAMLSKGLLLAFTDDVLNGDIHPQSFAVLRKHFDPESQHDCWCELPGTLSGVHFQISCDVASSFQQLTAPGQKANGLKFMPNESWLAYQTYRVVLKGDLIRTVKTRKAVDANHLPPWLNKRQTGDGIEGGTFESWFQTGN
jgi:hypothetical protein